MKIVKWAMITFMTIILVVNSSLAEVALKQNCVNCEEKENYEKLLSELTKGDTQALKYFIKCQANYDGGNLGDLYRASGIFLITHTNLYLFLLEKESLSDNQLENFLLMLPLETVDNIDLKKGEIKKRLESIRVANDSEIKKRTIKILEKKLNFLSLIAD